MDATLVNNALRPPILDGTNYSIWKVKIRYYIKSIDERAWQRVINGWTPPRRVNEDGDSLVKPESDWTTDEVQISIYNSKALNAIFSSVDMNMFGLITNCISAKDAWDILQKHCEGSESVRRTRLRMLTSKFETMRMEESENILEYDRRLFNVKICAIDEAKDTSQMALEDLISSLRTFEMNMDMQKKETGIVTPGRNICAKLVCLKSTSSGNFSENDEEAEKEEITLESVQKLYEELFEDWTKKNELNSNLMKENTELKSVVAKLQVILCKKDVELGKTKDELQKATETLSKFNSSTSKLETILSMGRYDKKGLGFKDSVFEFGVSSKSTVIVNRKTETFTPAQPTPSTKSFTLKRQSTAPVPKNRKRRYVCHYCFKPGHIRPCCFKLRDDRMNQMSSRLPKMLHNTFLNTSINRPTVRQVWVPKVKIHCNVVYTSLKTNTAGYWYFDSGSSRHMTGSREYLINYVEQKCGRVTYGRGAKGKIVGKGTLNVEGLPKLHNVLHVEGLNSNLIRISQLCDDNLHVKFNKHACEVFDESNICNMTGTRYSDNCYKIGEELSCKQAQITELDIWHQKLGHVNFKTLKNLSKYEAVRGKELLMSSRHQKLQSRIGLPSINVVFDDCTYLKKKTAKYDVIDLLENPIILENEGVVSDVATPSTTRDTEVTDAEDGANSEDDVVDDGLNIQAKIQKNHPSSQIIGSVQEEVQTRKKEKVDYRKMVGLV
ncbi:uncharacterized protein LOC142550205 [Primulina tabacum]|uniref:uncharacterized protein LOC142550205 n=1 Tax=Primulina tabacum TaxID=48773 RepID=UPI003F598F54